jgi:hypothetical protein
MGWTTVTRSKVGDDFGCGGKNGRNLVPFIGPDGKRGGGPGVRMATNNGGY